MMHCFDKLSIVRFRVWHGHCWDVGWVYQADRVSPLVIFRTKKLMIILSLHYNLCLYLKAWAVKTLSSSIRIFSRKLEVCFLSDCDSLIQIFRFSGIRKIGMVDTVKEKGPRKRFVLFYYVFLFLKNCLLILNVKNLYIKRQSVIYLYLQIIKTTNDIIFKHQKFFQFISND